MSLAFILGSFIYPRRLPVGSKSPSLSLTADQGTWVRSIDHTGSTSLLLLFLRSLDDMQTVEWLQSFQKQLPLFEEAKTKVFAVASPRPEKLRSYRQTHSLDLPLLYDPLSIEARRFGMSGRRFYSKNGVVLIDQDSTIQLCSWQQEKPEKVLSLLGLQLANPAPVANVKHLDTEQSMELLKKGQHILIDVRTFSEYDADHVPGSIHLPIDELQQKMKELSQTDKLLFICQAGGRAYSAAEFMHSIGSKEIYVVEGGMSKWSGPRITGGK